MSGEGFSYKAGKYPNKPGKYPSTSLLETNCAYLCPSDYAAVLGNEKSDNVYLERNGHVVLVRPGKDIGSATAHHDPVPKVPQGVILLSPFHETKWAPLDNTPITVSRSKFDATARAIAVVFMIKPMVKQQKPVTISTANLNARITEKFVHLPLAIGQDLAISDGSDFFILMVVGMFGDNREIVSDETTLTFCTDTATIFQTQIKEIELTGEYAIAEVSAVAKALMNLISDTSEKNEQGGIINAESLGIGGLNKQFKDIFRRAFMSRIFPPDKLAKLGQTHVKGLLLYGPPGTGKTLTARKIGELLNARPPKMVSGSELLDKYIGGSEQKVRDLFSDAFKEWKERENASELHIIIIDELDAVCKQRGSKSDNTGTMDSLVNQLLAMMDGPDALGNVLVVGMTNRKELLDEALMRPGRFEVHLEIGLPDCRGREQILRIHTKNLVAAKSLASDVNIAHLAECTPNFSGAELAGLVRSATSFAMERAIEKTKSVGPNKLLYLDMIGVQVEAKDFERALGEVKAGYGQADRTLLDAAAPLGILKATGYESVVQQAVSFGEAVLNSSITTGAMLLAAPATGTGCTALCSVIAKRLGCEFVRIISAEQLVMRTSTEYGRADLICQIFEAAYRVPRALIILDGIESIIQYTPIGFRFSSTVLQTLTALIRRPTQPDHRLVVLGTTTHLKAMSDVGFAGVFNQVCNIPSLTPDQALCALCEYATVALDLEEKRNAAHQVSVRYYLQPNPVEYEAYAVYKLFLERQKRRIPITIRSVLFAYELAKTAVRKDALSRNPNAQQAVITDSVMARTLNATLL
ncbi:Vesicle-fusing ATPase [Giardia duodenalis]|uniref:Vesicle-fusing ATPase n=1 Tax=Giardia intestinalis (strain ATCC 50803 / WB clone C6) TaxID=184922 RepID=A0A644F1R1_GIAIC|nr:Vesicle-fusing ATPase [Giardia intestinalis]KAE8302554.1 Vesicle-fusing ATPase [Giardia intestinalis]